MKRKDIPYLVSLLLLILFIITAITGYIQSKLELRRFIPHRYFAYATIILFLIHVFQNIKKLYLYFKKRFRE
jgi:hypothetical protein